jgi:site-specific DNA-methyltransferase (adenine-specific)/adenine-specific DNA-methyltransferase
VTPEQRQQLIRLLEKDEEISPEWARILFPPEKREYELVYQGKDREEDIIAGTLAVPLQPVRTFGRNGVDWHNMLIFGDNLQAMKTLLEMKQDGRLLNSDGTLGVRLVYIDPPFATRREFQGSEDQKAYQDKLVGAEFLEFLRKRLILLRQLMADDGSIYIHLDWKKVHAVKLLADEIFGENRFVREIIWRIGWVSGYKSVAKNWVRNHETILFYSMNPKRMVFNKKYIPYPPDYERWGGREKGQGLPIEDVWGVFQKEGVTSLQVVSFARQDTGYPTQKPEGLVARIIEASSNEGDIVLDAFAGSGTMPAVAEKLKRRWVAIDCGKLSIYTIQKRMLTLHEKIGNTGKMIHLKPFTLYNAGLYDFSKLKELSWQDWRFFALQLFGCRDERHKIGGIAFDGHRQGHSVMVFNHMEAKHKGACITEETIQEIHEAAGSRVGSKVFIIAPALSFDFQQDYIDLDKVRYYALRIPYSIIHELHRREFTALKQPSDEMAVNDTVDAVGFDFIRTPELKYSTGAEKPGGELYGTGFIKIETFKSDAVIREPFKKKGNLETLSMVMLDFNYDETNKVFDLDAVFYAEALAKEDWKVRFQTDQLGKKMMAVFLDIYGNEARVLIDAAEFGTVKPKKKNGKKQ